MTEYETLLDDERATIEFGRRLAIATFSHPWNLQEVVAENQGVPTIGGRVHLLGELGAGKTTLTRGILRGYGYEGAVKSPLIPWWNPINLISVISIILTSID